MGTSLVRRKIRLSEMAVGQRLKENLKRKDVERFKARSRREERLCDSKEVIQDRHSQELESL